MALPRGAMGLSAVCDCDISWSYSLTIFYFKYTLYLISNFLYFILLYIIKSGMKAIDIKYQLCHSFFSIYLSVFQLSSFLLKGSFNIIDFI